MLRGRWPTPRWSCVGHLLLLPLSQALWMCGARYVHDTPCTSGSSSSSTEHRPRRRTDNFWLENNKIAAAMTMAFSVPAASVTPACCRQRSRESLAADSISGARLSASNSAEALVEGWLLKTPNHFQHKIREALRKRGRAGGWSFSSRTKDTRANHLPCACWAFT